MIDLQSLQAVRQQALGQIDQATAAMRAVLASSAQSAGAAAAARASADEAAREARRVQGLYAMGGGAVSQQPTEQAIAITSPRGGTSDEGGQAEVAFAEGQLFSAEGALPARLGLGCGQDEPRRLSKAGRRQATPAARVCRPVVQNVRPARGDGDARARAASLPVR